MLRLTLTLGCALSLILLLVTPVGATPGEFPNLESAIRAARRGPVRRGVTPEIATEAVAKLPLAGTSSLVPLARVSTSGGKGAAAAQSLIERYLERETPEQACLQAILELPEKESNPALVREASALRANLQDAGASGPLLKIYGRVAVSAHVRETLEAWSRDEDQSRALRDFLSALGRHHRPAKLFSALLQVRDLGPAEVDLCQTQSALIKRDPKTRKRALALLSTSPRKDRIAAALAIAGVEGKSSVRDALEAALSNPQTTANGLRGLLATRRCRPATLERVVGLTRAHKTAPAALAALPRLLSYCKKADKSLRDSADRAVGAALESPDSATLVAAVNTARQLRHSALPARLPQLLGNDAKEVRLAAIRAVPRVLKLDAAGAKLLLGRFNDPAPEVANLAWKTLQRWAKVSIPRNRTGLWEAWRSRTFGG